MKTMGNGYRITFTFYKYRGIYPSIVNIRNAPSYLFQSDLYYYNEWYFG